jgi:hypothetical protein
MPARTTTAATPHWLWPSAHWYAALTAGTFGGAKVSIEAKIAAVRRRIQRPASLAVLSADRGPAAGSFLGDVVLGSRGEAWPVHKGRPMRPICQINRAELPHRPQSLADIALVTVFMHWGEDGNFEHIGETPTNGNGWLLRTYADIESLVELVRPAGLEETPRRAVQWKLVEDVPSWDYVHEAGGIGDLEQVEDFEYSDHFQTLIGFKVGGWPYTVQSEVYWAPWNKHPADPEFVFQVDSEDEVDLVWGDCGVAYFGRGRKDPKVWAFEWQCC